MINEEIRVVPILSEGGESSEPYRKDSYARYESARTERLVPRCYRVRLGISVSATVSGKV